MNALYSSVSGLCILEEGENKLLISTPEMKAIPWETAHITCGAIDDWEIIVETDRKSILTEAYNRHCQTRCLINIETCLSDISADLQMDLIREIEDLLKTCNISQVKATLLRAPLASLDNLTKLIEASLSNGFTSTASLLDSIREMQPQLNRFVDRWLSIPEGLFIELTGGRANTWRMAVNNGVVLETLSATNVQHLEKIWQKMAFYYTKPSERVAIIAVSKAVSNQLFPSHAESCPESWKHDEQEREFSNAGIRPSSPKRQVDSYLSHLRAIKQVEAITAAISVGNDAKARRFLYELVEAQKSCNDDEYLIKSLCNIAHQCAEMFRTDFEYECLLLATKTIPGDGWTLIQLADHFKRVGKFEDAISYLHRADGLGEHFMAQSTLAGVYVQMKNFPEAIAIYESLGNGDQDLDIRLAKADVLRKWGKIDEADREYNQLINEGFTTDRLIAGKAEIAKRKGRFQEARGFYGVLLEKAEVDSQSSIVYRTALANVLVRIGDLTNAYEIMDTIVQERPFAERAKVFRAAIAGMLGNPDEAIKDLPNFSQTSAYDEWVREYVRGLLLLMLNRHSDARSALLQKVEDKFLDMDGKGMLRLGAAVYFLQTKKHIVKAEEMLAKFPETSDVFIDSIRSALQYHVAVALRKNDQIRRLEMQLDSVADVKIRELVSAIAQKDWIKVYPLEISALLQLAA